MSTYGGGDRLRDVETLHHLGYERLNVPRHVPWNEQSYTARMAHSLVFFFCSTPSFGIDRCLPRGSRLLSSLESACDSHAGSAKRKTIFRSVRFFKVSPKIPIEEAEPGPSRDTLWRFHAGGIGLIYQTFILEPSFIKRRGTCGRMGRRGRRVAWCTRALCLEGNQG